MYYSNARKTAKLFAVFFAYCICRKQITKKEERNIEKEIQNQPPYSGGV